MVLFQQLLVFIRGGKMKKRFVFSVVLVIVCLAIGGIATAMTISPVTNLTPSEVNTEHSYPGIFGNYAVWDRYFLDGEDEDSDVYLYDLTGVQSPNPKNITDNEESYHPSIDNGRIVYARDIGSNECQIRMYTLPSGPDELLADNLQGWEAWPDISGDNVVYRTWDDNQGRDVIMYLNLAVEAPTPVRISSDGLQCGKPAVSGDYVAFEGDDGDYDGIYLNNLNLFANDAIEITQDIGDDYDWPNIDGKTVVYENDDDDIINAYNIDSTVTKQISRDSEDADQPDIQGNNIVYASEQDDVDPDEWVTFYNMVTGVYTSVSDPENYCCPDTPAVYGNNVLYLDHWDTDDYEDYPDSVYHVQLSPTLDPVPGLTAPINIEEGQTVWQNPYIIKVYPTGGTEIVRVEFYIDGVLIGTIYAPNSEGVWECPWDTSLYHSLVRVVAFDAAGDSVEITRNTTVSLPYTGR
jgi:hypothetical protein